MARRPEDQNSNPGQEAALEPFVLGVILPMMLIQYLRYERGTEMRVQESVPDSCSKDHGWVGSAKS